MPQASASGWRDCRRCIARYVLAMVLADLGEFPEALGPGEEGLRIAQTAGHPYSEVWLAMALGYAHLRHGDFAAATRMLEPGLASCRGMEIHLAVPSFAASLGSAYLVVGARADAVPLLEEAVESDHGHADSGLPFLVHHVLGRGLSRVRTGRRRRDSRRSGRWRWRTSISSGAGKPGA